MKLNCTTIACIVLLVYGMVDAKTILLTGGAGFIGSHVAEHLLHRGDNVIIVDKDSSELKQHNLHSVYTAAQKSYVKVYVTDIRNMQDMDAIVKEEKPDCICHLAAKAGTRHSTLMPEEYLTTNIVGTMNIFELAKKYKIGHIAYASSSSVYGETHLIPFAETAIINEPLNVYSMSKASCELLAYVYHHLYSISSTGMRFFTVYGPRVRPDLAPFIFMDAIYHDQPITLFGDGSVQRDFTYIDDIVDGVLKAIDQPLGYCILNLGRGMPMYIKDLITTLETIIQKKAIINYQEPKPEDSAITFANVTKAKDLLGYCPRFNFADGIAKMYTWYREEMLNAS